MFKEFAGGDLAFFFSFAVVFGFYEKVLENTFEWVYWYEKTFEAIDTVVAVEVSCGEVNVLEYIAGVGVFFYGIFL